MLNLSSCVSSVSGEDGGGTQGRTATGKYGKPIELAGGR